MRYFISMALALCVAFTADARIIPSYTYQELFDEADLVLVVKAISSRVATENDEVVPIERIDGGSRTNGVRQDNIRVQSDIVEFCEAIITQFEVLAIVKGEVATDEPFHLCHYRYLPNRRIGRGPLFVNFDSGDGAHSGENPKRRHRPTYILFLKRDDQQRWTFLTEQYNASLSVRKMVSVP
ncbi:MAG: hypothetical protein AAF664_21070 [Planctomycetota bacterium]